MVFGNVRNGNFSATNISSGVNLRFKLNCLAQTLLSSETTWLRTYNGLSYNGLSCNNLAILCLCVFPGWSRRIMFTAHSGDLPHVLPWPQDAGVHLGPPYTWVTLVVSPAA